MHRPHRSLVLASIFLITAAPVAQACRVGIKFKNETGQTANDLHIKFNRGVDITATGAFGPNGSQNGHNTHDLSGGSVTNGSSTKIDVTSTPCDNIQIRSWWWTNGGVTIGGEHDGEPKATISFSGPNAAGNGVIRVRIDAVDHFYNMVPGASPQLQCTQFNSYLSSLLDAGQPLIHVIVLAPPTMSFVGNVLGDPAHELSVQVMNPDAAQSASVTMGNASVPAQSPAGLVALATALSGFALVAILRRRNAGALAA